MADGKNKVIFYRDWRYIFDALNDDEAGKLIKHFFAYIDDENPKPVDRVTELSFIAIKSQLKRDLKKYNEYVERQRLNGSKGGRPKETQKTQAFSEKPKKGDKDKDKDKDKDSNTNSSIPSLDEFLAHANDRHPLVSPELVRAKYYTWVDNDWLDGYDKPIKRWKSKLTNTLKHAPITKNQKIIFDASKSKHL